MSAARVQHLPRPPAGRTHYPARQASLRYLDFGQVLARRAAQHPTIRALPQAADGAAPHPPCREAACCGSRPRELHDGAPTGIADDDVSRILLLLAGLPPAAPLAAAWGHIRNRCGPHEGCGAARRLGDGVHAARYGGRVVGPAVRRVRRGWDLQRADGRQRRLGHDGRRVFGGDDGAGERDVVPHFGLSVDGGVRQTLLDAWPRISLVPSVLAPLKLVAVCRISHVCLFRTPLLPLCRSPSTSYRFLFLLSICFVEFCCRLRLSSHLI